MSNVLDTELYLYRDRNGLYLRGAADALKYRNMFRRLKRVVLGCFVGLLLVYIGAALFSARLALYPWWYKSEFVGKELPPCSSYQSRVYVHCQNPNTNLGVQYSMFESEKKVDGKLVRVSGWWIKPRKLEAQKGIVILVHGGGADRRAMLKHAGYLTSAGYHALLIDCHNHGLNQSDGTGISLGLWESESVVVAAEWAAPRIRRLNAAGKVESLPIIAMGTSMGAFSALRAAWRSNLIRAVVAENSYVSVRELLYEFPMLTWMPRAVKAGAMVLISGWLGHSVWQLDVRKFGELMGPRPVLLIHGEQDGVTTLHHSEDILDAISGPKALWRVPRGEHEQLWNLMRDEYEKKILVFLDGVSQAAF